MIIRIQEMRLSIFGVLSFHHSEGFDSWIVEVFFILFDLLVLALLPETNGDDEVVIIPVLIVKLLIPIEEEIEHPPPLAIDRPIHLSK